MPINLKMSSKFARVTAYTFKVINIFSVNTSFIVTLHSLCTNHMED